MIAETSLTGIFLGFKGDFNLKLTCIPCRHRNPNDKYEVETSTREETTGHVSRENAVQNPF